MRTGLMRGTVMIAALAMLGAAGAAKADGYPPFYGYSDYFGSPTTYFTPENTIHEVVTAKDGEYGFGTRTYYRGGPFWAYQPVRRRAVYAAASRREARARAHRRRHR